MVEKLVSVVLPIYNVEKYLNRCMESIVNQTYKDIEIIMVDDGSPDECPRMCDEWAKKDSRVKVIHKQNEGLGMARNTGIECANGEYICFFDSDDYVEKDLIEKAYHEIEQHNADIALFGLQLIGKNGEKGKCFIPVTPQMVYEGKSVQEELLPLLIGSEYNLRASAWECLYSMKVIQETGWCFTSERVIISEDIYSLLDLYSYINKAVVIPFAPYYYCDNDSSLSRVYREDRYRRIKEFYDASVLLCKKKKYDDGVIAQLNHVYLSFVLGCIKQILRADLSTEQQKILYKEIVLDKHFKNVIERISVKKESIYRKILIIVFRRRWFKTAYQILVFRCKV